MIETAGEGTMRRHIVRLARDISYDTRGTRADLSGGGVLLQTADGRKGIMTAEHCISEVAGKTDWSTKYICAITQQMTGEGDQGKGVAPVRVPLWNTKRARENDDEMPPDIAWIELHTRDSNQIERHGGVFLQPWRRKTPPAYDQARDDPESVRKMTIYTAVHGWFAAHEEATEGGEAQGMFLILEMLEDWKPPVAVHENEDGWDYSDYVFENPEAPSTPSWGDGLPPEVRVDIDPRRMSREGCSGCGIWRFWQIEGEDGWTYALAGIAYYENAADKAGRRSLRAHREESIARMMGVEAPEYYRPGTVT